MNDIVTRLQLEARTYQANGNPVHSLLSLAASEITMLRAMQGKEQARGGDVNAAPEVDRRREQDVAAGDAHPHKHAQAADPPPPEDALLTRDAELLSWLDKAITLKVINDHGAYIGDYSAKELARRLRESRDRIAADAKLITRMTDIMNIGAATVTAAEARAQVPREPTEDMILDGHLAGNIKFSTHAQIAAIWRAMYDAALASDSGKGRG